MGLTCSCLRSPDDENQLKIESSTTDETGSTQINGKRRRLTSLKISIEDLIKVQSVLRGYIERRKAKEIYHSDTLSINKKARKTKSVPFKTKKSVLGAF